MLRFETVPCICPPLMQGHDLHHPAAAAPLMLIQHPSATDRVSASCGHQDLFATKPFKDIKEFSHVVMKTKSVLKMNETHSSPLQRSEDMVMRHYSATIQHPLIQQIWLCGSQQRACIQDRTAESRGERSRQLELSHLAYVLSPRF